MKKIAFSNPGFDDLPNGIKKMLVATEEFLFREAMQPFLKARFVRLAATNGREQQKILCFAA
jgi:hypothetical protein